MAKNTRLESNEVLQHTVREVSPGEYKLAISSPDGLAAGVDYDSINMELSEFDTIETYTYLKGEDVVKILTVTFTDDTRSVWTNITWSNPEPEEV